MKYLSAVLCLVFVLIASSIVYADDMEHNKKLQSQAVGHCLDSLGKMFPTMHRQSLDVYGLSVNGNYLEVHFKFSYRAVGYDESAYRYCQVDFFNNKFTWSIGG